MAPIRLPSEFRPIVTIVRTLLISSLIFSFAFAAEDQSRASGRPYTIRLGIFSNSENARKMSLELERSGLEVFVKEGSIEGLGRVSMVYLGRFESMKEAERAAKDLVTKGLISDYVIKIWPPEGDSTALAGAEESQATEARTKEASVLEGPLEEDASKEEDEPSPTTPDKDLAEGVPSRAEEGPPTAKEAKEAEDSPPPGPPPGGVAEEEARSGTTPDNEAARVNSAEPSEDLTIEEEPPIAEQGTGPATQVVPGAGQALRLRVEAMNMSAEDVHAMLVRCNFYSSCFDFNTAFCNPAGDFENAFVDNADETVTDEATGLMWQRGGSPEPLSWLDAKAYVEQLNRLEYAGHTDWRLPTSEELASLIEVSWKNGDLYVSTVFDNRQRACWSADTRGPQRAWKAALHLGIVIDEPMTYVNGVRAVRSL